MALRVSFFFSSRRRHTRWTGDWSSDVCSSDLHHAFIIDSAYAAQALPIISAWWAANGNQPNVHEATAGFTANIPLVMTQAPRIANEAINVGITAAYYNAAGIPDAAGNPWSKTSPNVLNETQIGGGALF